MRGTKAALRYTVACLVAYAISAVVLHACTTPQVAVVVRNEYFETMRDVRVGTVNFGTLASHTQSAQKMLTQGTWDMHGITHTGLRLTARLKVMHRSEMRIIITHKGGIRTE